MHIQIYSHQILSHASSKNQVIVALFIVKCSIGVCFMHGCFMHGCDTIVILYIFQWTIDKSIGLDRNILYVIQNTVEPPENENFLLAKQFLRFLWDSVIGKFDRTYVKRMGGGINLYQNIKNVELKLHCSGWFDGMMSSFYRNESTKMIE